LANTVCVALSTCGDMKVTRLEASLFPDPSTSSTGRFILSWLDFSIGT
jgi:hypothetical protein